MIKTTFLTKLISLVLLIMILSLITVTSINSTPFETPSKELSIVKVFAQGNATDKNTSGPLDQKLERLQNKFSELQNQYNQISNRTNNIEKQ